MPEPESSLEHDWRITVVRAAAVEMERHARALIDTANLLRIQLGDATILQVRLYAPPPRRKKESGHA